LHGKDIIFFINTTKKVEIIVFVTIVTILLPICYNDLNQIFAIATQTSAAIHRLHRHRFDSSCNFIKVAALRENVRDIEKPALNRIDFL